VRSSDTSTPEEAESMGGPELSTRQPEPENAQQLGPWAIEADLVSKTYPARDGADILALDEFSLRVGATEFVAIIGPSGCGKSTFLKMVAGLESISAGSLTRAGAPITRPQPDVGFVFQAATLLPWLTVLDNVLLPAQVQRLPKAAARERAHGLLESVGLADFHPALPVRTLRWHAAAGGDHPRTVARPEAAADGRAVRRARRAHPRPALR
jgi:ABC-type taurine transport system ATPase subunit